MLFPSFSRVAIYIPLIVSSSVVWFQFEPGASLTDLYLEDIDMYCDCCWQWAKGSLTFNVHFSDKPCKKGPTELTDKLWADITLEELQCPGNQVFII